MIGTIDGRPIGTKETLLFVPLVTLLLCLFVAQ
jgi:hypothetical protein